MGIFGGGSPSPSSAGASAAADSVSAELKASLIQQVQAEAAINNARLLVNKINENCFDRCIPTPGSSLSSGESTCLTSCMEKYINMWTSTQRTYVVRVQKESKALGGGVNSATLLGTPSS